MHILNEYRGRPEVYIGRRMEIFFPGGYASGGAGYVITKKAVRKIVEEGSTFPQSCPTDGRWEDLDIGRYSSST